VRRAYEMTEGTPSRASTTLLLTSLFGLEERARNKPARFEESEAEENPYDLAVTDM